MTSPSRFLGAAALLLALALAGCGGDDSPRGELVGTPATTASLGTADIDASVAALPGLVDLIGGTARCSVTLHKLVYQTVAPNGTPARASLGLLVPQGCAGPYPTVVYHHGTQLLKSFAMSDPANLETFLANAYFASQGYVVVMPDYLGYGESSLNFHPYLDVQSMADVAIDALRAARNFLQPQGVSTSGKLFLTGYSQGGHSAMATQRVMERDHAQEFVITATAPMAGFYSLTATFVDAIYAPTDLGTVLFAFGLTGLQRVYGDVYGAAALAFQPPWASGVEGLLPGTLDLPDLFAQGKLPPQALTGAGGLLTDAYSNMLKNDANSGVRRRLAQNDLIDWTPKAPMTMCHGGRDTVVPAKNMQLAAASFALRGAPAIAVDLEQIPAFKAAIDAQVAAAGTLLVYHAQIAPPLCFSVTKNQVFDPLR
jgi:dienelactone hydrolase